MKKVLIFVFVLILVCVPCFAYDLTDEDRGAMSMLGMTEEEFIEAYHSDEEVTDESEHPTSDLLPYSSFETDFDYYTYLHSVGVMDDNAYYQYCNNLVTEIRDVQNRSSYDSDSGSDMLFSDSNLEVSEANPSILGESPLLLASVPGSGSANNDPTAIGYDYAPDAEEGTLLEVLYALFGKPVTGIHYQWRTSNTNNTYAYSVQEVQYDVAWISQVVLFILVLFCIFKAGGALLCKL